MLAVIALFFLVSAIALFVLSERRQKSSGIPSGRLIYTDMRGWGKPAEPLYDPVLNLVGKPDYLVENGKHIIPVEVKTSRPPEVTLRLASLPARRLLPACPAGLQDSTSLWHPPL